MVVGAPRTGAAYIFRRSSTGVWRQHQILVATDIGRSGGFGAAVAIDRAMIIVGAPSAPGDDPDNDPFSGAAYGFTPGGGVYVETFKLRADDDETHHSFGRHVAMFDQRIVVGAQQVLSSDSVLNGVLVFTYTRAGSSVMGRGVAQGIFASTSLSLANQRLLVGVPCTSSTPGFCAEGKVDLYNLTVSE